MEVKERFGRVKGGYKYCWLHERERCLFFFVLKILWQLTGNQFGPNWDPHHYQYDPKNLMDFV